MPRNNYRTQIVPVEHSSPDISCRISQTVANGISYGDLIAKLTRDGVYDDVGQRIPNLDFQSNTIV